MQTDYYQKYKKYKQKYLNQRGGEYKLDENNYDPNMITNIQNPKYIAGPVSIYHIRNEEFDKNIYLIGDIHISTDTFKCASEINSLEDDSSPSNTIYFPQYLKYLFEMEKTKVIDVFIEIHYLGNKIVPQMKEGMIENVRRQFEPCFRKITDKVECNRLYPNVRFHVMDIRYYMQKYDIALTDITTLAEYIKQSKDIMLNKDHYDKIPIYLDEIVQEIFDSIRNDEIVTYQFNDLLNVAGFDASLQTSTNNSIMLKSIYELLIFANTNREYLETKYYDILGRLMSLKNLLMAYNNYVEVPDFIIDMIRKYLGDENGIYPDIDTKLIDVIRSSPLLTKNVNNYVIENFKPNILEQYVKSDFQFKISDIIKTKKLTAIDAINFDHFYSVIYGSSKIYVNACIHICFRVGFHCYAMEFCEAKRTKNICVCMQTHIFLQCGAALMDMYILGRLFKKFVPKTEDDISAEYAKNIIIITGARHTQTYLEFFKKINSEVLYETKYTTTGIDATKRCVPFIEFKFI